MASVNKVFLLGHLGRDPELRFTPNGTAVCNITIATSRSWKDQQSGEKVEETEWHRVVFYDRLAEVAGEYLRKGRPVHVEGRLRTRKWTDKDGVDKYTTEIVVEELQLLGDRDNDRGNGNPQQEPSGNAPASPASDKPAASKGARSSKPRGKAAPGAAGGASDDDIPF